MSDDDSDNASSSKYLSHIPQSTLALIDDAFDSTIKEARGDIEGALTHERQAKRRRLLAPQAPDTAGGFILDDENNSVNESGGFLVGESFDGTTNNREEELQEGDLYGRAPHIPLSLVPRALQILDLDPSDASALAVFSNASERPSSSDPHAWSRNEEGKLEDIVTRNDFREVCAALLPQSFNAPALGAHRGGGRPSASASVSPLSSLNGDGDDGYSDVFEESGASEDEYVPEKSEKKGKGKKAQSVRKLPAGKSRSTRSQSKATISSRKDAFTSARSGPRELTARQEQDTLSAYSLFFPELRGEGSSGVTNAAALSEKRLTIKDIANAASLIKEKLTVEDVSCVLPEYLPSQIHLIERT